MKTSGTRVLPADADQAIDITTSFDVTYFSSLLNITPECLRTAVNAAGPRLGDVRRYLEGAGAGSKVERRAPPSSDGQSLPRSSLRPTCIGK